MTNSGNIKLEYVFNTSPRVLFPMLATPAGLSKWFADEVDETFGKFTFTWGKVNQDAQVIAKKEPIFIRFHWEDDDEPDTYFEFVLSQHELTGFTELIINDMVDDSDIQDTITLWNTQVASLKRVLGV